MPFRLNEFRAKIQFTTSARMPYLIYQACLRTGIPSNTVYCQLALAEKLAKDLGVPLDEITSELPAPRGPSAHLYDPTEGTMRRTKSVMEDQTGGMVRVGPANTDEQVR